MRVAAWLRRIDMELCDRWYEACGRALHVDGRRFYERDVAIELLESIGAPPDAWDDALADDTTHDDVRADHDHAVAQYGSVRRADHRLPQRPSDLRAGRRAGADRRMTALELWELSTAYSEIGGLFELKTPKTAGDLRMIADEFQPYLTARQWSTIQNPAP